MRLLATAVSLCLLFLPAAAVPAMAADEYVAQTASDPSLPLEDLKLLLKPLTADELTVEADAWLGVLKEQVAKISNHEIKVKEKNREMAEAKQVAAEAAKQAEETQPAATEGAAPAAAATTQAAAQQAKAAEAKAEQAAADKAEKLDLINQLQDERTRRVDRLNAVLTALEAKGGDRKSYDLYVTAVSGITVDVSDVSATSAAIMGWLKSPEGGIRWGRNIILFFVVLVVFWILSKILGNATYRALRASKNTSELLRDFGRHFVGRVVLLAGLLFAITMLEVNVGPLLAVVGAGGFILAFALQGTLSNFAAGLMILAYRPYDVGDFVNVAGVAGTVESMTLVSTQIKTPDNQRVVVPNNSIWGGVVTNVTGLPTRRVDLVFGIGYSDDAEKAERIMREIVDAHPLVLKDPEPVIKLHELADSSVNFVCRPWTKTSDYWTVYWDVTAKVKERFDAEGVSIPFPQQDVHMYQESPTT